MKRAGESIFFAISLVLHEGPAMRKVEISPEVRTNSWLFIRLKYPIEY